MDVLYFLKERTRLIRAYYEQASQPFTETMRKIEAQEEPYLPTYSEDPGPAFLAEWIEAENLLQVTARCCVSMLSASLQLYFKAWEWQLGLGCRDALKGVFKKGWLAGYRACLTERLKIDWTTCPADLAIIEQVILARHVDQHPETIGSIGVSHTGEDLRRHPKPFFMNEREASLLKLGPNSFLRPGVHVASDKLMAAISQVEVLCIWLEAEIVKAHCELGLPWAPRTP